MRVLAIAALVLLTGCAATNPKGGTPTATIPKFRPIENSRPVPLRTFKARFGQWREITKDIWITKETTK